jgi:hypothetical protein
MAKVFAMNPREMMCRVERASAFGGLLVESWEAH